MAYSSGSISMFNLTAWRLLLAITAGAMTRAGASGEISAQLEPRTSVLPAGPTDHFARVNGINLHYLKMGEGPVLLLLHGWPQTSFAWRGVMPRLAKHFTVIAPDMRGTGLSECAQDGYDKRSIAD